MTKIDTTNAPQNFKDAAARMVASMTAEQITAKIAEYRRNAKASEFGLNAAIEAGEDEASIAEYRGDVRMCNMMAALMEEGSTAPSAADVAAVEYAQALEAYEAEQTTENLNAASVAIDALRSAASAEGVEVSEVWYRNGLSEGDDSKDETNAERNAATQREAEIDAIQHSNANEAATKERIIKNKPVLFGFYAQTAQVWRVCFGDSFTTLDGRGSFNTRKELADQCARLGLTLNTDNTITTDTDGATPEELAEIEESNINAQKEIATQTPEALAELEAQNAAAEEADEARKAEEKALKLQAENIECGNSPEVARAAAEIVRARYQVDKADRDHAAGTITGKELQQINAQALQTVNKAQQAYQTQREYEEAMQARDAAIIARQARPNFHSGPERTHEIARRCAISTGRTSIVALTCYGYEGAQPYYAAIPADCATVQQIEDAAAIYTPTADEIKRAELAARLIEAVKAGASAADIDAIIKEHTDAQQQAQPVTPPETAGEAAYIEDCRRCPLHHDGTKRQQWEELAEYIKDNWERHPTPRDFEYRFAVIVSNIGTVYQTNDRAQALKTFDTYEGMSKYNKARESGESVTLTDNGEPIKEYAGTLEAEETE